MTHDPFADSTPPSAPPRHRLLRAVIGIVVFGLIVFGVRFALIVANNMPSKMDTIVASMAPTPSVYNTKLTKVVDADRLVMVHATRVLSDAKYLSATPDYLAFDNALSDARTTLDLSGSFQIGTLSKEDYVTAMAGIEASFSELTTAQTAIEADMIATPAPASTRAATPAPAT